MRLSHQIPSCQHGTIVAFAFATVILGMARAATAQPDCVRWEQRGEVSMDWPVGRAVPAMAYDRLHGQMLVAGGYASENLNETWGWDGREWAFLSEGDFTARRSHVMVYDTARDTAVLFGGYGVRDPLGDTWERGPSGVWTLAASDGPSPRGSTAMVYDARRGVTVLFGGYLDGRDLGDTWEWDGVHWTQVADSGPIARRTHAMAYDSRRGVTVLCGGYGLSGRLSDTWEWDGSTWTQVGDIGPGERTGHQMAYDEQRGQVLLFGGSDDTLRRWDDLWAYNGLDWTRLSESGPGTDSLGRMAYDSARGVTVLFGGDRGRTVWEWDGEAWHSLAPSDIGVSRNHGMVYDSPRGAFVLFGGSTGDGLSGKTWVWSGQEWNLASEIGPSPRSGHKMVFDEARGVAVLFGGDSSGETWEWNGEVWTQVHVAGPPARAAHAMAYDSLRSETVLFGGYGFDDTWVYANGQWRFITDRGPSWRYGAAMVYDPVRDNFVLYGGQYDTYEETILYAETWILDTRGWHRAADASPGPLAYQAMTFDTDRGMVLMHGGSYTQRDDTLSNKLWQWDGTHWTLLTQGGPTAREAHAIAYDPTSHSMLLFGGWDDQPGLRGDSWTYGFIVEPSLSIQSACPQSGPAQLTWSCASTGGIVGLAVSPRVGLFRIPGGQPCAGTWINLQRDGLRLLGLVHSNQSGSGSISGSLSANVCGGYIQLIDVRTCQTSYVGRIE